MIWTVSEQEPPSLAHLQAVLATYTLAHELGRELADAPLSLSRARIVALGVLVAATAHLTQRRDDGRT